MLKYFKRIKFKTYLYLRIRVLWLLWYPRYYRKLNKINKGLAYCTKSIPSFKERYPFLNKNIFKSHCQYWIHWITKMDPRERLYFKDSNPYLLISEDGLLYFDLKKKELPLYDYTYYWPDSQWISIEIFHSFDDFLHYVNVKDDDSVRLVEIVNKISRRETMRRTKERMRKNNTENIIIEEGGGFRISKEFLERNKIDHKAD